MGRSKQTGIGRSGEYFVAHILELAEIEVYRVDGDCDLLVSLDGALLRVEVKSATAPGIRGSYRFNMRKRPNADFCAFVALDLSLLRLIRSDELGRANIKSLHPIHFTPSNQNADIQRLIEALVKQRAS